MMKLLSPEGGAILLPIGMIFFFLLQTISQSECYITQIHEKMWKRHLHFKSRPLRGILI